MSKIVIKNKVLKCSSKNYFLAGAEQTQIGSYGKKKKSGLGPSFLFPHDILSFDKTLIKIDGPHELDTSSTKEIDLEIPLRNALADGSVTVSYEALKTKKLKLIELHILPARLVEAINLNPNALDFLKRKKNVRLVYCIFIALESEFYSKIDFAAGINAESTLDKGIELSLKIKGGGGSESKLTLASNTILAYGLAKPVWDKVKTRVIDLDPDQKGLG